MKNLPTLLPLLLVGLLAVGACKKEEPAPTVDATPATAPPEKPATPLEQALGSTGAFAPLPDHWAKDGQTAAQEELGRLLYFEPRLSKNHDVSCNTCHDLAAFGVDNKPTSPGHKAQLGGRNSPTVYNAAGHFRQFWDGRAADVEEQAKGPILNPVEMAMPGEEQVVAVLKSIPGYAAPFAAAFPGQEAPISYDNMAKAIGAFERRLVTPSRWDDFLRGKPDALSEDELKGFNLFVSTGCVGCHNGALIGGTAFQKVGAVKPWPNQKDQGVFDLSKKDDDKMMFKAPSLRNIAKTAPYFHDGSAASLEESVKLMAAHQLGRDLSAEDTRLITAWLNALTGTLPTDYIQKPTLPESGPETPKPDPT